MHKFCCFFIMVCLSPNLFSQEARNGNWQDVGAKTDQIKLSVRHEASLEKSHMTKLNNFFMSFSTLPPKEFLIEWNDNHHFFEIIAPDDDLFDYRTPDYKGGFYLFFRIVVLGAKEVETQIPFAKAKRPFKTYIAHYASAGYSELGHGWRMPNYQVSYVEVPNDYDFQTFDATGLPGPWNLLAANMDMPQDLLMRSTLNLYSAAKRDEIRAKTDPAYFQAMQADETEAMAAASREHLDMALIEQLKATKQYDTLVQTPNATVYINTDLESYEYPVAFSSFHVIYKKFYPNGSLKERRKFLPGVYASQNLPMGIAVYYDETGEPTDVNLDGLRIFSHPALTDFEFCLRLLEREGYIDRKTGKGKASLHINAHVDPLAPSYGEPRLAIDAPWGIQADDTPNGTIALLVRHSKGETVYLIDKNGRTIMDKFKR